MRHRESTVTSVSPEAIVPNPNNPRRYFNERSLDELRSSIQNVGILVPLIVYEEPSGGDYVLLDGERRLRCAFDLALPEVPVNVIPAPTQLDNILRMFNIHAVREEWPLVSIALSLRDVIEKSGESREAALAELTGLGRGTVRRAKRLLDLPPEEMNLIQEEAHLPREQQVHREDLYLEISDAESAIRREFPELSEEHGRTDVIRRFAEKYERKKVKAVTDYRAVPKLIRSVERGHVARSEAKQVIEALIDDVSLNPASAVDELARRAFEAQDASRRAELLVESLQKISELNGQRELLEPALRNLLGEIQRLLSD